MRTFRAAHRSHDEHGFVLVFVAITLVLLLAMAGFVVDLTNWNLQRTKIQRAADAAALAGAVFLPDDPQGAIDEARRTAASNG